MIYLLRLREILSRRVLLLTKCFRFLLRATSRLNTVSEQNTEHSEDMIRRRTHVLKWRGNKNHQSQEYYKVEKLQHTEGRWHELDIEINQFVSEGDGDSSAAVDQAPDTVFISTLSHLLSSYNCCASHCTVLYTNCTYLLNCTADTDIIRLIRYTYRIEQTPFQ